MTEGWKRLVSFALVLCMVWSMAPVQVFASETEIVEIQQETAAESSTVSAVTEAYAAANETAAAESEVPGTETTVTPETEETVAPATEETVILDEVINDAQAADAGSTDCDHNWEGGTCTNCELTVSAAYTELTYTAVDYENRTVSGKGTIVVTVAKDSSGSMEGKELTLWNYYAEAGSQTIATAVISGGKATFAFDISDWWYDHVNALYVEDGTTLGISVAELDHIRVVNDVDDFTVNGIYTSDVDLYILPGELVTVTAGTKADVQFGGWAVIDDTEAGWAVPVLEAGYSLGDTTIQFKMPEDGCVALTATWEHVHEEGVYINHWCEICGEYVREWCTDEDNDHVCDNGEGCAMLLMDLCADDNGDHKCDVCGRPMTELCADDNGDHICDTEGCKADATIWCSDADGDGDHKCNACAQTIEDCRDNNSDLVCDECGAAVECDHWLEEAQNNGDGTHTGTCDYCQQSVTEDCEYDSDWAWDENDHWDACICGAEDPDGVEKEAHTFTDGENGYYHSIEGDALGHNHECDGCCYQIYEAHVDEDLDHICDLCRDGDGEYTIEAHTDTDTDTDHICDVDGCEENVSQHVPDENGKCDCGLTFLASVTDNSNVTTYYATVQAALNAAAELSGSTVTLLADADVDDGDDTSVTDGYISSGVFTIDLNGKRLINSGWSSVLSIDTAGTDITITDTSAAKTGKIDGGEQESTTTFAVRVYDDAKVTINGGTFTGSCAVGVGSGGQDEPATLVINGGIIQGSDEGLDMETAQGNVTVNGGSISGQNYAIWANGTLTIHNAPSLTSVGDSVICYAGGTMDLTQCTSCNGWIIESCADTDLTVGTALLLPTGFNVYEPGTGVRLETIAEYQLGEISDHAHQDTAGDGDHICEVTGCGVDGISEHTWDDDGNCTECGESAAMLVTYADGSTLFTDDVELLAYDADNGTADDIIGIQLRKELKQEGGLMMGSVTLDLNGFALTGEMGGTVAMGDLTITGSGTITSDLMAVGAMGKLTIIGSPTLAATGIEGIPIPSATIAYISGDIDLSQCTGYDGWTIINMGMEGNDMPISDIVLSAHGSVVDEAGNVLTAEDSAAAGEIVTLKMSECIDEDKDGDHDCDICGGEDVTEHEWEDADCVTPKTCSECGETEGDALGHGTVDGFGYTDLKDGTHNVTCKDCGETTEEGVKHTYDETTHQCLCGDVEQFTVQIIWNGEAVEAWNFTEDYGTVVNLPTGVAPEGHSFTGYAEREGGEVVTDGEKLDRYTFTKNTNLYSVFEVNEYTVTWIVEDETYETTVKYGETIEVPEDPALAAVGCTTYTFSHWNGYTNGMKMPAEDQSFRAVFTEGTKHLNVVTDKAVEAECETTGKTEGSHCEACDTIIVEQEIVPATGHRNKEVLPAEEATCTETGLTAGEKCADCGKILVEQEEIPMLAHSYSVEVSRKEATCVSTGSVTMKCGSCTATTVETLLIDKSNHVSIVTDAAVAPGCVTTGKTEGAHCADCGTVTKVQETIAETGHKPKTAVVENRVEPTCGAEGSYDSVVYCAVCNEEISRETISIPATGKHAYTSEKERVEATCTADGYVIMECICGAAEKTVLSAVGHTAGKAVIEKEVKATCTTNGSFDTVVYCSVCKAELSRETTTVPATGHSDADKDFVCDICGEELCTDHIEESIPGKDATCTESGLTEGKKCAKCGEILLKQEVIPAAGHTKADAVTENEVAADCTKDGSYDTVICCDVCGKEISRETTIVPAKGHTEEILPGKEATCTEDGLTMGKKCSVCGEILKAQEVIPAKDHVAQTVPGKAATCTEDGLTDGIACSVCGETLKKQERIPAMGHSYTNEKDPSCNICGEIRDVRIETVPMYRLYNPVTGEHHYTGSAEERDNLAQVGWNYEGVAWNAPVYIGDPVYRFYNPNTGDHHYTTDFDECGKVRAAGWIYEGVAWNSAPATEVPIYRLYNPNAETGIHHYTGSAEERDWLVSLGWKYEGIGWYGLLY